MRAGRRAWCLAEMQPRMGALFPGPLTAQLLLLHAGQLSCAPNTKNPRDLDISLAYNFKGKKGSWSGKQDYRMR